MTTRKTILSPADALAMLDTALSTSRQAMETVTRASAHAGEESLARYGEVMAISKDGADAVMAAGSEWMKGMQGLSQAMMGLAHDSVEKAVAHGKAATAVKSVNQLVTMNRAFARSGVDQALSEGARLSQQSLHVAEAMAQPLNQQVEKTLRVLMKPLSR